MSNTNKFFAFIFIFPSLMSKYVDSSLPTVRVRISDSNSSSKPSQRERRGTSLIRLKFGVYCTSRSLSVTLHDLLAFDRYAQKHIFPFSFPHIKAKLFLFRFIFASAPCYYDLLKKKTLCAYEGDEQLTLR